MREIMPLMWMTWLSTAEGERDRSISLRVAENGKIEISPKDDHSSPPDPKLLATGLRYFADEGGLVPPAVLHRLADMFDPPSGYKGANAKLSRPRGGRSQEHDRIAIGRHAYEQIKPGCKVDAVIFGTAKIFSCDERTVRRALEYYRSGVESAD